MSLRLMIRRWPLMIRLLPSLFTLRFRHADRLITLFTLSLEFSFRQLIALHFSPFELMPMAADTIIGFLFAIFSTPLRHY
jgi:hypothetical protein